MPISTPTAESKSLLLQVWNSMLVRLQRPVEGILVPLPVAQKIGEPLLHQLMDSHGDSLEEAQFSAEALRVAAEESKELVAGERSTSHDSERYRDPEDRRYERNLNLTHLQKEDKLGCFNHSEWTALDRFLRPFSASQFRKKNIAPDDADEIYNSTLAYLAHKQEKKSKAPIQHLKVFEEIIPNFCRLISLRSIDWLRRHLSKKARPDSLTSLDAMTSEEGTQVELVDHHASDPDEPATWRFEEIYRQCRELLTPNEWSLIYKIYIAQTHSVKDLVLDQREIVQLGLDPSQSPSTLRRRIDDLLKPALIKLADALAI
ncbi:hypothetical protein N9891_01945 [bacterium]|nr:hypothetical protein [bacterium]